MTDSCGNSTSPKTPQRTLFVSEEAEAVSTESKRILRKTSELFHLFQLLSSPPDKRPEITYLISECLLIIKSMPLYQNRSTFPDFLSKYWIWFIYIILQYKQFLSKYYHPTFFITKRLYNIKLVNHYFKNFTCRLPF